MSRRRKSHIKKLTFSLLPVIMIAMVILVAGQAGTIETASGMSGTQWESVRGYLSSYISGQFGAGGAQGEAGFVESKLVLQDRLDNGGTTGLGAIHDATYLGEGDDAANAPVLIDNLRQNTDMIPGTSFRCRWTGQAAGPDVGDCFTTSSVAAVKSLVDAHKAAGFSTDLVVYCGTGHTQAPTTGAYGFLAQTGGLASDASIPKVYGLKWGRAGWANTTQSYAGANATAAPDAPTSTTNLAPTIANCGSSPDDVELVRCMAEWAMLSPFQGGGNIGSGQYTMATVNAAGQTVDIRTGDISNPALATGGTVSSTNNNIQVPIDTVFTTAGLAKVSPSASTFVTSRTPMVGGIVAEGYKMLGYTMGTGGFVAAGMPGYNSSKDEKWVAEGSALVKLTVALSPAATKVDTASPVITGTASVSGITGSSATIGGWTTDEPTSIKVEYGTSTSYGSTAYDTVLHANRSTYPKTIGGLSEYTHYYYRITGYDAQANATTTPLTGDFWTKDVTGPVVGNLTPSGTVYSAGVVGDATVINADFWDISTNVNPGSISITLDGAPLTCNAPVSGSGMVSISCPVPNLVAKAYTIGGSVSDLESPANSTTISGGFTVVDNVAPDTPVYTGPSGNIKINNPTITGTYNDPLPSSGIAGAQVSLDGTASFVSPNPCTVSGGYSGTISCPMTGLADGNYQGVVSIGDNAGAWVNSSVVNFTVDTVAPSITGIGPSGWINTGNPATVSATLSDSGAGIDNTKGSISVDGTPLGSCTVTGVSISCDTSAANFGEGAHTISVTAYDRANNPTTTGGSFSVDSADPVFTDHQPTGVSPNTSQTITASYNDVTSGINTASVAVTLDGSPAAGCSPATTTGVSCAVTGLSSSVHNISVSVTDTAGNTTSLPWTFEVNTAAPDISDWYPKGNNNEATPVVGIAYTSSGTVTGATITVTGGSCDTTGNMTQTEAFCDASGLADGNHDVVAEVTAGGVLASKSWSFTKDTAAPTVDSITPAGPTNNTSPTIEFDVSDGSGLVSGNNSSLTDLNLIHGSSPSISESPACTNVGNHFSCPTSGLVDAEYNVMIDVTDNAGNHRAYGHPVQFKVDTTVPLFSNIMPAGMISDARPHITGNWSDTDGSGVDSGTFVMTIDGTTPVGSVCTDVAGGFDCTLANDLAEGPHTIGLSVRDNALNLAGGAGTFTIDTTGPVSSNITPSGWINDATPLIEFDVTDAGAGIEPASLSLSFMPDLPAILMDACTYTGTPAAYHFSCQVTSSLSAGSYETHLNNIQDTLGNDSLFIEPEPFMVDLTNPEVTSVTGDIISISANLSDTASGINASSAVVTLDGNAVSGCTRTTSSVSCPTPGGQTVGSHTISVSVNDNAGNTGTGTGTLTITDYPSIGAISVKRGNLGGATGPASGPEYPLNGAGGQYLGQAQDFSNGMIIWSPTGGTFWIHGGIYVKYIQLGGAAGFLGMPKSEEYDIAGGRGCNFAGGRIYWSMSSGAHAVNGAILTKLLSDGGVARDGFPMSDEYDVPGHPGARASDFQRAQIYWTAGGGAHTIFGAIMNRYVSLGGPAFLGLPMSDEYNVAGVAGGRESDFQRGRIYYHPATGAREVYGGILSKYLLLGGPAGFLGMPSSGERDVTGVAGARQGDFQRGSIYWSPTTGARSVNGGIHVTYMIFGGPASSLGLPVTDEYSIPGGRRSKFQHGYITLIAGHGAWVSPM